MPGAPETTKYMTSAGTVTSSYHEEPRLLLYHGGMERYIGTWDIQMYLLVFSCPFITANGQLQQPMPGKSKATKSLDLLGMRVCLDHPAREVNDTHQSAKRHLGWVVKKKNVSRVLVTH